MQCEVCHLNYISSMEMAYGVLGLEYSVSSVVQAQKIVQGDEVGLEKYLLPAYLQTYYLPTYLPPTYLPTTYYISTYQTTYISTYQPT
jgi:hypothetical protein